LKKGDLGGFENLQLEGIYGKRYNIHVILNEAQRREESQLFKKEILRCAQNDK
jgi:hypothetical protein